MKFDFQHGDIALKDDWPYDVSPSRQDGKISRPVRLAETTKLVSYTDVNSTRHIVQMKLVWSQAMDDGSDRYISKRNCDKKLINQQDEDWNEPQVRPISKILAAIEVRCNGKRSMVLKNTKELEDGSSDSGQGNLSGGWVSD
ncbi:hypothetical protein F2Q68_00040373 [Brassica cretica]|uniref:Uncharacterized protein n=1 Tax=Brassica cretica TaxID=69181 RepID=A0A8S9MQ36_BRACR|nr:hypothetical protein F2Q68_00040373 [Brassica cretica]